jgi:phosphoglycerate dehydrogenase-like enzyme
MSVNKLLILSTDAAKYNALIEAAGLQKLQTRTAADATSAKAVVNDCNIILGNPLMVSEVLVSAQELEWVQSSWAGVDTLCKPGLRRDYVLTGVKNIFGPPISEYVMTYLFALERRLFTMRSNQLEKRWQSLPYRPSQDITIGIIGLGSIGGHLARTARHFGIRVIGFNRSGRACEAVEKVFTADDLAGFLQEPDYIVLTLPDTPQTKNLINADVLKMMKSSAVLINVGRGNIINEADLVDALLEGSIGGAVLDVFASEPLAADSPFWRLSNVYVTPHNAAISFPEGVVEVFIDNYQRFIQNRNLCHIIDFELGY